MDQRVTIAKTGDVPPGRGIGVNVEGLRIAVFNVDGQFYAVDDTCTHAEASLSEGDIDGATVTCPLHGAEFDLVTGAVLAPPAEKSITVYKVHVVGEEIQVELE
jgi:3-phenylpropionate/trans-cinnamate dioxygenase ferredoxin subunit